MKRRVLNLKDSREDPSRASWEEQLRDDLPHTADDLIRSDILSRIDELRHKIKRLRQLGDRLGHQLSVIEAALPPTSSNDKK